MTDAAYKTEHQERPTRKRRGFVVLTDAHLFAELGLPNHIGRRFLAAVEADPDCGFPQRNETTGHWPMGSIRDWFAQLSGLQPGEKSPWPIRWPKGWDPSRELPPPPPPRPLPRRPYVEAPGLKDIVYFIRAGDHIKIGVTSGTINNRLKALSTAHYEELIVLATVEDAKPGLEMELHQRFAALRVRGEWFKAAPELLAYIEDIRGQK